MTGLSSPLWCGRRCDVESWDAPPPAARARQPRGRAGVTPQPLEVTLDGLRQLHRRLEQRQPESDDWPLVCALVWNQIVRAEGRQERMASKDRWWRQYFSSAPTSSSCTPGASNPSGWGLGGQVAHPHARTSRTPCAAAFSFAESSAPWTRFPLVPKRWMQPWPGKRRMGQGELQPEERLRLPPRSLRRGKIN
jgi:hypothetical protein